jgi:hypothetical protein
MADTTTTTLTELVNAEAINPAIMSYAHDFVVAAPYTRKMDLRGLGTKVGSFPRWVLDTATDTGETTSLTTETLETTAVNITAAEIGVRRDITDAAIEETILGAGVFTHLARDFGVMFGISLDDDIVALFAALNSATAVGTTKVNLTLANMVEAQATIRQNGAPGALVYVLDDQQALDYQAAQQAATQTTTSEFMTVAQGNSGGFLGTWMGQPVWQTGLCDTANTAENVVGACFIDGEANPELAAIGMVLTRDTRIENDRNIQDRNSIVVGTAKWGVGEIADTSGVPIVTDA